MPLGAAVGGGGGIPCPPTLLITATPGAHLDRHQPMGILGQLRDIKKASGGPQLEHHGGWPRVCRGAWKQVGARCSPAQIHRYHLVSGLVLAGWGQGVVRKARQQIWGQSLLPCLCQLLGWGL